MKQDWNYSYTEIENMLPYERDLEMMFIIERIKEKEKKSMSVEHSIPTEEEFKARYAGNNQG